MLCLSQYARFCGVLLSHKVALRQAILLGQLFQSYKYRSYLFEHGNIKFSKAVYQAYDFKFEITNEI